MKYCISILTTASLLFVGCAGKSSIDADQKKTPVSETDAAPANSASSDSLTQLIAEVAISFHNWYIKSLNDDDSRLLTSADVVKGANGKCKLVNDLYFAELRKLGTVSEKFIQSEEARTKPCADFLATVDWKTYKNADAYTFSKHCPEFDYDYWVNSQEVFAGVIVDRLEQVNSKWIATLAFTYDAEKQEIERISQPRVTVEREGDKWMITKITWIKNQ